MNAGANCFSHPSMATVVEADAFAAELHFVWLQTSGDYALQVSADSSLPSTLGGGRRSRRLTALYVSNEYVRLALVARNYRPFVDGRLVLHVFSAWCTRKSWDGHDASERHRGTDGRVGMLVRHDDARRVVSFWISRSAHASQRYGHHAAPSRQDTVCGCSGCHAEGGCFPLIG